MKAMIAKYPGTCARTGAPIRTGDPILWSRSRIELDQAIDPDLALAASIDPELAEHDPEGAANAGRYLRRSMGRSVSHLWTSGGREYYQNKRGRCEDAPCCGCCNA